MEILKRESDVVVRGPSAPVKRKQGQQPKWDAWVRKMDEVINREHPVGYAVIYNDTMLLEMVNAELPEDERITMRTFTNYKQEGHVQDGSIASLFVSTYKRALSIQADNIFRRMVDEGPGSWQKWAWILERKFDEWNLRSRVVDETPDVGRLVFRAPGSSDDSKEGA